MAFEPHEIEWTREKASRLWDHYEQNPSVRQQCFAYQAGAEVARRIDRLLGFAKLRRILDFGCGLGDLIAACLPYLRSGQTIEGVDISPKNVEHVLRRFEGEPAFGGAWRLTSSPGPIEGGGMDLVMATEVVEHLEDADLDAALAEMRRLMTPGGALFLTTPNEENRKAGEVMCPDCGCVFHRWQHVRAWSAASLAAKMGSAGFATLRCEPVAWGESLPRRLLSRIAPFVRPAPRTGLVYLGRSRRG